MIITDIKKIDSKKCLVCINYEPAFALYNAEIRRYKLNMNEIISKEVYEDILWEVLFKRCRERVGYILGKSDKSVYELKVKLKQGYYPNEIIDTVVEEYIRYDYINDDRYSYNYLKNNIRSKSINRIKNELLMKGISKDRIINAIDEIRKDNVKESEENNNVFENVQSQIIEKEFIKRKYDFNTDDRGLLNKIISSLIRKGFEYDDIVKVYNSMKNKKIC
ncbi:MAG: RecX family transcriptional regulator [Lachnospiraceae bacterium]|nr:RecX family transcriptional regulator [Lachnospiraceae bacterium]